MADTMLDNSPRLSDSLPRRRKGASLYRKVIDVAKTMAWVLPITILIWTYAERQQAAEPRTASISIAVRIDNPDRIATLNEPGNHQVVATLRGPSAGLQKALDQLKATGGISYTVPSDVKSGKFSFQAIGALQKQPAFEQNGVTVSDVTPSLLQITVDDIKPHLVTVKAPKGLPPEIDAVQFAPANVTIRGPESIFTKDNLYVEADMAQLPELKQPGQHSVAGVAVSWPFGSEVTISPQAVNVTFTVKSEEKEDTEHGVAIWPALPAYALQEFQVETAPSSLSQVTFVGPQDQLNELKNSSIYALLVLPPSDLHEGSYTKIPLYFRLPPQVHVQNNQQYFVDVKITKRQ